MKMKNKLYCHHKSKFSLVMRNFSIFFASFSFVAAAVAIPTYISIHVGEKVATEAANENKEVEEKEDSTDLEEEKPEELVTLSY